MPLLPRVRTSRTARASLAVAAVLALAAGVLAAAPQNFPGDPDASALQAAGTTTALTAAKDELRRTPGRTNLRPAPAAAPDQSERSQRAKAPAARPRSNAEIWAEARARRKAPKAYGGTAPRKIDCRKLKCIALTFDDGPAPGLTDRLLEVLAAEHVRASFFVLGKNVAADPGPLIRAAWDGHEIGVHTWDHRALPGRSTEDLADDLTRTMHAVTKASGVRPRLVRPPFGALDPATARRIPYPLVLWSVDPDDWRDRNRDLIVQRVTAGGRPGSVVLLHDVHPESVAAVPAIIDFYRRHGYTFVTVSELYGSALRPHHVYRGREAACLRAKGVAPPETVPAPKPARPVEPTPTPAPVAKPDEAAVGEGEAPADPTPDAASTPTPEPGLVPPNPRRS